MVHPVMWGPHGWKFLHYVTLNYPERPTEEDKEKYKQFFLLLQRVLPCERCAYNFSNNLKTLPLTDKVLESDTNLMYWLIDMHNMVNKETGKKEIQRNEAYYKLLYDHGFIESEKKIERFKPIDVKEELNEKVEQKPTEKNSSSALTVTLCIIILILIAFFMFKKYLKKPMYI